MRSILGGPAPTGRLDLAALELATIEHPDLDPQPWLAELDRHATNLSYRVAPEDGPAAYIEAVNEYLFGELGFTGADANYYDPRSSCLNDALEHRTGLPITLSVIYIEIARRLRRPIYGVGLPGHFIVVYDDGLTTEYLDPYHGGTALSPRECFALASKVTGAEVPRDPTLLARVTHRQILQRMLNNLRSVYVSRQNWRKAIRVLDLWLEIYPDAAPERKQRGIAYLRLDRVAAARDDLQRYLDLSPDATDREEIQKQVQEIRQYLAGMN